MDGRIVQVTQWRIMFHARHTTKQLLLVSLFVVDVVRICVEQVDENLADGATATLFCQLFFNVFICHPILSETTRGGNADPTKSLPMFLSVCQLLVSEFRLRLRSGPVWTRVGGACVHLQGWEEMYRKTAT